MRRPQAARMWHTCPRPCVFRGLVRTPPRVSETSTLARPTVRLEALNPPTPTLRYSPIWSAQWVSPPRRPLAGQLEGSRSLRWGIASGMLGLTWMGPVRLPRGALSDPRCPPASIPGAPVGGGWGWVWAEVHLRCLGDAWWEDRGGLRYSHPGAPLRVSWEVEGAGHRGSSLSSSRLPPAGLL